MYHRRLLSEMLWTGAESGKVTQTQRLGGSVSLVSFAQTTAGGCGSPGSGPSSGSGSSDGGEVVAASGGGNADSPAYSCGGTGTCGIGKFAQIVTLGAADIGVAASAGVLPA